MNTRLTFPSILCLLAAVAVAADTAISCEPGYFVTKSGACQKCPKGYYQPLANQDACKPCHDGMVAMKAGSTKCVPCTKPLTEANESNDRCKCVEGAALLEGNCTLCEPGTYFVSKGKKGRCDDCPSRTYQPEKGQTKCLPCPYGSESVRAATECKTCAEGEFLSYDTGDCTTCPKGQTKDKYSNSCTECEPGTFKPQPGLQLCQLCPSGSTSLSGASSCTDKCPVGEAPLKSGKCGKCPAGTYYDEDSLKCPKCYINTYMPYESIATSCFSCTGNTFAPKKGAKECIKCPFGTGLFKNGECGTCPGGFEYWESKLKCSICPRNSYKRGDNLDLCKDCPNGTFALPGSADCQTCPAGEAFIAKTKKCGKCKPGFFYYPDGLKCAKCHDGFYQPKEGISQSCFPCNDGMVNKKRTACVPK